jgi:hypothetical protein
MTFRQQVRLARRWGAACFAAGLLLMAMMFLFGNDGARQVGLIMGMIAGVLLAGGALMLLFFGAIRPVHRWQWHNTVRRSTLWGGYLPRSFLHGFAAPFWRRWLHIDCEGNDLDARP